MTKRYKITLTTNNLARDAVGVAKLLELPAGSVRHNGGKICVATVEDSDAAALESRCDDAYQVSGYVEIPNVDE